MVIILAGADGTGKSTCFEELKKRLPQAIFIKETHTTSAFEKMHNARQLEEYIHSPELVIYDRAMLLDDLVYSRVIDHEPSVFDDTVLTYNLLQCRIIYFTCNTDVLAKRLNDRGDEFINSDQLEDIVKRYNDVFREYNLSHAVYPVDTTSRQPDIIANLVEAIITCGSPKLAEIVPKETLEATRGNAYHMCLAPLVLKDPVYAAFYRRMSDEGKFVLLDNGAAEGDVITLDELIEAAEIVDAAEIVLPDTLAEGQASFDKSISAYYNLREYKAKSGRRLMCVPQGRTPEEWFNFAKQFLNHVEIDDIGVPKHLPTTFGASNARFEIVSMLDKEIRRRNRYNTKIHLLGCNEVPKFLGELLETSIFVRGCDTVAAYLYAKYARGGAEAYFFERDKSMEVDMLNESYLDVFWQRKREYECAAKIGINGKDNFWR